MRPEPLILRWTGFVTSQGLDVGLAGEHLDALLRAYCDPRRAYHYLGHLAHMFREIDAAGLHEPAVEWAVWFHDAIYKPLAGDNEIASAAWAHAALADLGVAAVDIGRAEALILATRDHRASAQDEIGGMFLDADLAILGAEPAQYRAYAQAIRKEYSLIPGPLYRRRRNAFIEHMLAREAIYNSHHFQGRYELQARRNLAMELSDQADRVA